MNPWQEEPQIMHRTVSACQLFDMMSWQLSRRSGDDVTSKELFGEFIARHLLATDTADIGERNGLCITQGHGLACIDGWYWDGLDIHRAIIVCTAMEYPLVVHRVQQWMEAGGTLVVEDRVLPMN